ncbi:MAG TPA: helix-turn-helix domain-containing protein [Verrucomicrobiae bacterium]|nr:helix-turn-helix domain-containing protein [Verrucomicrobiae bacterium]
MTADSEGNKKWQQLAKRAEFKPAKLARAVGVSLRTLQRHFRLQYQITVSEWLSSIRLQEAYHRILAGDRIKEVAFDLGYKQLSHFSREFKRCYGVPPTLLMRSVAENAAPKPAAPPAGPGVKHAPAEPLAYFHSAA